ncbi:MAG: M20/M25/M40 family metallo-hydrolase, partial [Natronospirillum sp.]
AYHEAVDTQPVGWSELELRLDIPTASAAETQAAGVQLGNTVSVDPQPECLPNGYLVSRFLDNKAALACCLEVLTLLQDQGLTPVEPICFAFTNAEEVGHGAGTALPPSVNELISVDIAPVSANQNSQEDRVTLGFKDASGPYDQSLLKALEALAQRHNIPYVRDVFRHYHSDCSSALKAGLDVRTALIGFGTDSTHGYERTHINSLIGVTQLLLAYTLSPP